MKGTRLRTNRAAACRILPLCLLLAASASVCRAQSVIEQGSTATASPAAQGEQASAAQSRVERARSLAVIGNFTAAASELEAARAETTDDAVRDVARILLMSVYLKQSNYTRADGLLDESFKARSPGNENTTRVYYALAGQLINGVRSRLDRYREFGVDAARPDLPNEARSDVDQLRVLTERVVEQAREIRDANRGGNTRAQNMDALALLEDAAAVRLTLARTAGERAQWQREVSEARQYLATSQTGAGTIQTAARRPAAVAPTVAATTPATQSSTPAAASPANNSAATDASRNASGTPARGNGSSSNSGETAKATPPQPSATPTPSTGAPSGGNSNEKNGAGGSSSGGSSATTPVAVGSLAEKATQKVSPSYPPMARNLGVAGVVTVYLVVNERGDVEAVERALGPSLLQRPALDAARRWKFRPTVIEGQPVRVAGYISFNFAL